MLLRGIPLVFPVALECAGTYTQLLGTLYPYRSISLGLSPNYPKLNRPFMLQYHTRTGDIATYIIFHTRPSKRKGQGRVCILWAIGGALDGDNTNY